MSFSRKTLPSLGLGLFCLIAATSAHAHLVTTGLGPVYDGIGHFCLSPDDVVPAVALALLVGMRSPRTARWALAMFPTSWMAGGLAGLLTTTPLFPGQIPVALSFLLLGILIASDLTLPVVATTVLGWLVGGVHGFFNGMAMREAGIGTGILELMGIGVTLFVIIAIGSGFVISLRPAWARIVVRVAGSWIAATGLLLLGWAIRTPR